MLSDHTHAITHHPYVVCPDTRSKSIGNSVSPHASAAELDEEEREMSLESVRREVVFAASEADGARRARASVEKKSKVSIGWLM